MNQSGAVLDKNLREKHTQLVWGFTLIEILVSIAVIVIVILVIVSGLSSFRKSAELNQAVDGVVSQLREARRRTIESKDASRWGVHVESSRTTLFKGVSFPEGTDKEIFVLPTTVTIAGPIDIVFKRISGDTDNAGTVTLALGTNTRVINIRSSGLIELQ
ncbi:MAG: prepilin-type N-terminal cleavage/methylation domain-containing protein [Candidatus Sungiibacteriota bacterium]